MGCACAYEKKKGAREVEALKTQSVEEGESWKEATNVGLRDVTTIHFLLEPIESCYNIFPKVYTQGQVSLQLAEFKGTRQKCIIRSIPKNSHVMGAQVVEKLQMEVAVLSKIDHPHILRTFETLEDDESYFIVSEAFLPGELKRFLERGKLLVGVAVSVMEQVLSAVFYCHQQGIVHRNLKLDNLVLQEMPSSDKVVVKVAGFSDACFFSPSGHLNTIVGSCMFIAPEVLQHKYTEKCDIWSCGVLFYYLLTGAFPFTGESTGDVLRKVRTGDVDFEGEEWSGVDERWKEMVRKMLQVDVELRPSASQCLHNPWFSKCCSDRCSFKPVRQSLVNILTFQAHTALKQAIMMFIISRIASSREIDALTQSFRALDRNKDGRISKDELRGGFERLMPADRAEAEMERVMQLADLNGNGTIEYTEFLISSFSRDQLLSHENLYKAFSSFDHDNSGKISVTELKNLFIIKNREDSEKLWSELVKVVDSSGDGEIDFHEFVDMMTKSVH